MNNGGASTQKQKSERTRQKILAAFLELMKRKSFDDITTREICALAQVSNGAFFHQFNSKAALLNYYVVDAYRSYLAENASAPDENPYAVFFNQNRWTNTFSVMHGVEFITNYYTPRNQVLATHVDDRTIVNQTSDFMIETFEAANRLIRDQWVRPGITPAQIEADFRCLRHGVIFDWCASDAGFDLEQATRRLLLLYFRAISTPEGLEHLEPIASEP